jgi:cobalt/nickel transport system permease protein
LDARAKLIAVIVVLAFIATARPWSPRHVAFYAMLAAAAALLSQLSWAGLARRLALLLPFPVVFAVLSWVSSGQLAHAAALVTRSIVSASFAVILIGVTPVPELLEGAGRIGVPRVLITVTQFLYRYLFVLFDQAVRMKQAAACRGGFRWSAASGAAAALFASSEERAARVHRAMLARGFHGHDPVLTPPLWRHADTLLVAGALIFLSGARLLWQL